MGKFDASPEDVAWHEQYSRHHRGRMLGLAAGSFVVLFGGGVLLRLAGTPLWGRTLLLLLELAAIVTIGIVSWRWFRTLLAHNDPYLKQRHPNWTSQAAEPTTSGEDDSGHDAEKRAP